MQFTNCLFTMYLFILYFIDCYGLIEFSMHGSNICSYFFVLIHIAGHQQQKQEARAAARSISFITWTGRPYIPISTFLMHYSFSLFTITSYNFSCLYCENAFSRMMMIHIAGHQQDKQETRAAACSITFITWRGMSYTCYTIHIAFHLDCNFPACQQKKC